MTIQRVPPATKTLAVLRDVRAYTLPEAHRKNKLHSSGRAWLRSVAKDLELPAGSFEIRSNLGGMAVSGEVTLHGEHIYMWMYESCLRPGIMLIYRNCKGRKDYTGGANHDVMLGDLRDLENYRRFIERCKRLMEVNHAGV